MSALRISTPENVDILVVEDSPTQAQLLTYILAEHGYHVFVACNGREALVSLRQHMPTMVISDVRRSTQCMAALSFVPRADPNRTWRVHQCVADPVPVVAVVRALRR